jgi:glycosyltransferase involved in cell wall biosynthesis
VLLATPIDLAAWPHQRAHRWIEHLRAKGIPTQAVHERLCPGGGFAKAAWNLASLCGVPRWEEESLVVRHLHLPKGLGSGFDARGAVEALLDHEEAYDIVIAHAPWGYDVGERLRTARGAKRIVYDVIDHWPSFAPPGARRRRVAAGHRRALLGADLVAAAGPALALTVREETGREAIVIPNGVDEAFFSVARTANRPPTVLFVGALEPWAGIGRAVEAFATVVESLPGAKFLIAGDGPAAAEVGETIRRLALDDAVEMVGPLAREAVPRFLAGGDVGLLPFPLTPLTRAAAPLKLVEYLAAALPVVSTAIDWVADIDPAGEAVSVSGENPADLAAGMVGLLSLPDRGRGRGERGRTLAAPYRWGRVLGEGWRAITGNPA